MFTSPARLHIRRPSSTTVEFTVSNRPLRSGLTLPVLYASILILRTLVGAAVLFIIYAKWSTTISHISSPTEETVLQSYLGQVGQRFAHRLDWWLLLPLSLATGYAVFRRGYTEESLLVIRGLGIQTSTTSDTYLSTPTTRFIPTNLVQDIFIHEAFRGFEVRFYLAVVVEGEEDVVVVFPNLLPKRTIVEQVWRGARACLYEPKT